MDTKTSITRLARLACIATALAGCASANKAPAVADVAVSRNAVEKAVSAGAVELAPEEITGARAKMARANQALEAKDYKLARALAVQAQADAKLAQSNANSAKAGAVLNEDLRVLPKEVERAKTRP